MDRILKLLFLFWGPYEDVRKIYMDLYGGASAIKGSWLLGLNSPIKLQLFSQLSSQSVPFLLYGGNKRLIPCDELELNSNYVYIYSNHHNEEHNNLGICTKSYEWPLHIISKSVKAPFYSKWLGYARTHIELFGTHFYLSQEKVEAELSLMSSSSTVILNVAAGYTGISALSTEVILANFSQYISNPYIRYVHYIISSPVDPMLAVNTDSGVKVFWARTEELEEFTDLYIYKWQQSKIKSFIEFFHDISVNISGSEKSEFEGFIRQNIRIEGHMSSNGLARLRSISLERYKELLLFNFIARGDGEKALSLLAEGVNINSTLNDGANILYVAAHMGRESIIELLASSGLSIESTKDNNSTPLMAAAMGGAFGVVRLLLSLGAEVNALDVHQNTPLILAAYKGDYRIAKLLINAGAELNRQNKLGETALTIAVSAGNLKLVDELLKSGADPEVANHAHYTPLMLSAFRGDIQIANLLMDNRAETEKKGYQMETALSISIQLGNLKLVGALMLHGASIKTKAQEVLPIIAAICRGRADITALLVSYLKEENIVENLIAYPWIKFQDIVKYSLSNGGFKNMPGVHLADYILINSNYRSEAVNLLSDAAQQGLIPVGYAEKVCGCVIKNYVADMWYSDFYSLCSDFSA